MVGTGTSSWHKSIEINDAVRRLQNDEAALRNSVEVADTDTDRAGYQAALAQVEAELGRAKQDQIARQQRRALTQQVVNQIRSWLEQQSGKLVDVPSVAVPGDGSATYAEALDRLRSSIAAAKYEIQRVITAPLPVADIKARIRAFVSEQAKAANVVLVTSAGRFEISATYGPRDALAIAAWLTPDTVIAALEKQVENLPHAPMATPIIVSESTSHVVIAIELPKAALRRHRRLFEQLAAIGATDE